MNDRSSRFPRSRRCANCLLLAVSLGSLAGCAVGPRNVRTEVTAYNEWSALPGDRTYTFGRTPELQNSLELKSYEDQVRDALATQGFRLTADPAQAGLTVTLRPSVSSSRVQVRDSWGADPFFGPYGGGFYGGGFYGRGFGGYGGYGGFGPFYGGPYGAGGFYEGYNSYNVDVYRHRLELDIDSRSAPVRRYYEGRVVSSGDTESLQPAMPYLIRALFVDFPGNNGQTRRVEVPVERR